ncbi:MAG TPA: aspartyl protease family protein [Thermodesulfovibrionia bacterium]|nr:aspartyl protease family protein [Thermodesulfovibrionia bacterium]
MELFKRHRLGNRLISDAQKAVAQHKQPVEKEGTLQQHDFHITQVDFWVKVLVPLIGLTLILVLPKIFHMLYSTENHVKDTTTVSRHAPSPSKAIRSAYRRAFEKEDEAKFAAKIEKKDIVTQNAEKQVSGKSDDPLQEAVKLYEDGKLKEAAAHLKALLQQGKAEARLPLARVLRELNSSDCIQYFMEEAEAAGGNEAILYEAGMAMLEFDAPLLAKKYAERLIADNPQSYPGLVLMADIAESQEDWKAASAYLKKAILVRPDTLEDHWQLAWVYAQQGDLEASLSEYSVAADLAEDRKDRQSILQAIEVLQKAIERRQKQQQDEVQKPEEEKPLNGQTKGSVTLIPLKPIGKHFFVPLVLNNTLEAELLIDTGASITAISASLAEQLGLSGVEPQGYVQLNTAGGVVEAPVYLLPTVQFGEYVVENFRIAVLTTFDQTNMTGILGMDLLRYFHFSFDMDNQVLILQLKSEKQ